MDASSPPPSSPPDPKRRKLGLQVSIETGADGKAAVHQVFPDGSYIPATESHFERTSAAASAFVARALATPAQGSTSIETALTESQEPPTKWAASAVTSIEGSIYELHRVIAVIESLRQTKPILELKRTTGKSVRKEEEMEKEMEGMMMAKKRLANRAGEFLEDRIKMMESWIEGDNKFCEALLKMRSRCAGLRRRPDGTALIDVGDGDFVPIMRGKEGSEQVVRIMLPATTYLKFGVGEGDMQSGPVIQSEGEDVDAVIRGVKLARVSAFRRKAFEDMAKEEGSEVLERTTNGMLVECGARDVLRVEKTQRARVEEEGGEAGLLQIVMVHAALLGDGVVEWVRKAVCARGVVRSIEGVLDDAVGMLGVGVEWSRGGKVDEARAKVWDEEGRVLISVEVEGGCCRIVPAFGVIVAAPDVPGGRGKVVGGGLVDDVPRGYLCPVGGEVLSVICLLLCVRMLDALEREARSGVREMLDVDRQCFTLVVNRPGLGDSLKCRVWPKGGGVGAEVPGSMAWFNGIKCDEFPLIGRGRLAVWRQLLNRLVDGKKEEQMVESQQQAGQQFAQQPAPSPAAPQLPFDL